MRSLLGQYCLFCGSIVGKNIFPWSVFIGVTEQTNFFSGKNHFFRICCSYVMEIWTILMGLRYFIIGTVLLTFFAVFPTTSFAKITINDKTKALQQDLSLLSGKSVFQIKQILLDNEKRYQDYNLSNYYKTISKQKKYIQQFINDDYSLMKDLKDRVGLDCLPTTLNESINRVLKYKVTLKKIIKLVPKIEKKFQKKLTKLPDVSFEVASTLSPTNAKVCADKTVCLNLYILSGLTKKQLEILIVHELFHIYQGGVINEQVTQAEIDRVKHKSNLLQTLYAEGWATYASYVLSPGQSERDYLFQNSNVFKRRKNEIYQNILSDLYSNSKDSLLKYFSAKDASKTELPLRSGYYVGFILAKEMAEEFGSDTVLKMTYVDFLMKAVPFLERYR
jgi:uncharacterized protein YjaZ